jgi:hypothetical protein
MDPCGAFGFFDRWVIHILTKPRSVLWPIPVTDPSLYPASDMHQPLIVHFDEQSLDGASLAKDYFHQLRI